MLASFLGWQFGFFPDLSTSAFAVGVGPVGAGDGFVIFLGFLKSFLSSREATCAALDQVPWRRLYNLRSRQWEEVCFDLPAESI